MGRGEKQNLKSPFNKIIKRITEDIRKIVQISEIKTFLKNCYQLNLIFFSTLLSRFAKFWKMFILRWEKK